MTLINPLIFYECSKVRFGFKLHDMTLNKALLYSESVYSLVPLKRHVPINWHTSRHRTCQQVVFIKGASRSASKSGIELIQLSHASYFRKRTGSDKRSVQIT